MLTKIRSLILSINAFSHIFGADNIVKNFFDEGGTIHAFQFFGRRRYSYLQLPYLLYAMRNSALEFRETKMLSSMTFIVNTGNSQDIEYVRNLSGNLPNYFVSTYS